MADEVFALSPISARAAQPGEEDYAAIHEAFMETSRGRWFLGEYARRNRNADTRMVLDAVARIEQSLAAQKEAAVEADLTEALAAIREAVGAAQTSANAGLDNLAVDERLATIARSVRIIREISWRWREIGTDGRICDILDSQAAAIENSAGQISVGDARAAIDQAFATIEARIDEYSPGEASPLHARRAAEDIAEANVVRFPAPAEETPAADATTAAVVAAMAEAPVAEVRQAPLAETGEATTASAEPVAEAAAPIATVIDGIEIVDEAAADAHDEAMLDLIASEMSAPQPIEDDFDILVTEAAIAGPEIAAPVPAPAAAVGAGIEPVAAPAAPPVQQDAPAAVATATEATPAATQIGEASVSIGSAILASGILNKPTRSANDPLAPIRRMSQAERIAFFS